MSGTMPNGENQRFFLEKKDEVIQKLLSDGQYSRVIDALNRQLQDDKSSISWNQIQLRLLKAQVLTKLGEFQEALDISRELVQVLTETRTQEDQDVQAPDVINKTVFEAKLTIATALEGLGKIEESLNCLEAISGLLEEVPPEERASLKARLYYQLGTVNWRKGNINTALQWLEKALSTVKTLTHHEILHADILNRIGTCYRYEGNLDAALKYYEQSLAIREETGNEADLAAILNNIGNVHYVKGDLDLALEYHLKSLNLKKKIGNKQSIARALNNIGNIHRDKGEFDKALQYYQQSLELHEKIDNPHDIADVLNNIGGVYRDRGKLDQALEFYQKSLELVQEHGNVMDVAYALNNIGNIYRDKGELDKALQYYQQSLELRRKTGNPLDVSETLLDLGITYHRKGDEEKALSTLEECLSLRRSIGNPLRISEVLFVLIPILLEARKFDQASESMKELEGCLEKEPDNKLILQRLRTCQAIMLLSEAKRSKKRSVRLKAEFILEEIVSEPLMDFQVTMTASLTLCQHLLDELRISADPEILTRLHSVLDHIMEVATTQHSHWLLAEVLWLQAKLAFMEGEFLMARTLMTRAQRISERWGFTRLAEIISSDHDEMLKLMDQWEDAVERSVTLPEMLDLVKVSDLLRQISRQQVLNAFIEGEDIPVLLLLMFESGILLHSREFSGEISGNLQLISALLTAVRSFSHEVFNQGLNRMKLGEYTIVFLPHDLLLLVYVCKGSSYTALARLQRLRRELQKHVNLERELLNSGYSGNLPRYEVIQRLDLLIDQIFQEPNQQSD